MRIRGLKTYVVHCYRTNWVFVQVRTDSGIDGWGEATLEGRELTVVEAVRELGRYIVGKDPFAIERHHLLMQRDSYWREGPVLSTALGAVEVALWDIKGKALNVPVFELLGGLVNESVRAYANGWFAGATRPEEFAEKATACVDRGFRALKWDPFGKAFFSLSRSELNAAIECVAAVRAAVGPDVDLLIEAHGRFGVASSIQIARELAPFRPTWLEEPVPPSEPQALAQVREVSPVPIAAGERCYSRFQCAQLIDAQAVDVIQPDVCHVGGLLELKRVAALADAHYLPISPHNPNGPLAHAATLHFAVACHNFNLLETMVSDVPWRADIVTENSVLRDGCFLAPTGPGLGLEIHPEQFGRFPYAPRDLRHYTGALTDIRPPDAVPWYKS